MLQPESEDAAAAGDHAVEVRATAGAAAPRTLLGGEVEPSLRYIFRGGSLKHGSIVFLADRIADPARVTPKEVIRALGEDPRLDLGRFAVSYYSSAHEGYVELDGAEDGPTFDLSGAGLGAARLDLRLEDRVLSTSGCGSDPATDRKHGGYFGVGIYKGKSELNEGTLWRSAYNGGAAFLFSIGRRFERQSSDTTKAWVEVPFISYPDFNTFAAASPHGAPWVAVETGGVPLERFEHPRSAVYILGSEDTGLPEALLRACPYRVSIPSVREASYNVAVAGSIVMYDRLSKLNLASRAPEAAAAAAIAPPQQ